VDSDHPVALGPLAQRVPDPAITTLHPDFARLRLLAAGVERLAGGMRWAEGPVWFGDGRYLLVSDIPNDRILRWDDCSGQVAVFRQPSHNANGHARDAQGRLVSCEHLTRRITRTEHDGRITVLADRFDGARLNSPNDITLNRHDGALWFTDPDFGIAGHFEGAPAPAERPHAVYRIDADGRLDCVIDDLAGPNGLAFSPDGRVFYVIESRARPHRRIWAYDHHPGGRLTNARVLLDAGGPGALDGMAVDSAGNLWCGFGSDGSAGADPAGLDGVRAYAPDGTTLGHVHLPERCANVCFGGAKGNRLFMAATRSLYALHLNVQGAEFT
jgi:gluconolactonase